MIKTPVLWNRVINEEINQDSTVVDECKNKNNKPVERDHNFSNEPFYIFSDEEQGEECNEVKKPSHQPKPKLFPDFVSYLAQHHNESNTPYEPLKGSHAEKWKQVMDEEMTSFVINETFYLS